MWVKNRNNIYPNA
uniref:Uncharacterized protein n=1 Tax=Rhizophora mucronata TaxID=61149 RepID=A0A2P2NA71_RHIMU